MDITLVATIAFTLIPTAFIIVLVFIAAPAVKAAKAKGGAGKKD